jgi:hypothetical protein
MQLYSYKTVHLVLSREFTGSMSMSGIELVSCFSGAKAKPAFEVFGDK